MQDDSPAAAIPIYPQTTTPVAHAELGVTDALLAQVRAALDAQDAAQVVALVEPLHAADSAELLAALDADERTAVVACLREQFDPDVLAEASPELQDDIIEALGPQKSAEAIAQMDTDDAVWVIENLEEDEQHEILAAITDPEQRHELTEGLAYPESSAGRLMRTNYVSVPEVWSVGDTIDYLRRADDLPYDFYAVMVENPQQQPVGTVLLSRVMISARDTAIRSIMTTEFTRFRTDTDQEQVAQLFRKYALVEAPVVNAAGVLVGVVTVDDVVDVITEEDEEDIQKIGGVEALEEPYLSTPLLTLVKKRARWLIVLFLGELLTASAMGYFEDAINRAVVLALFVPLIISSGGNSGSQAATLVIRAMAVGEVKLKDWWRVMRRELFSGAVLGTLLGALGLMRIALWQQMFGIYGQEWLRVGLTVGLSLIGVVLWGTVTGSMLPFIMRRLGADPATSSTPFVATLVDVTGLVIYFTFATVLLLS